jgi:hypothetical protein
VGYRVGLSDGNAVGALVGLTEGVDVGERVGMVVGVAVGIFVGVAVGLVGLGVGPMVGLVGARVGIVDGAEVYVGWGVGFTVGFVEGNLVLPPHTSQGRVNRANKSKYLLHCKASETTDILQDRFASNNWKTDWKNTNWADHRISTESHKNLLTK